MVELLGCVSLAVIYSFLKGESTPEEPELKLTNEEETYEYFSRLTYQEQEQYYENNLDLSFYKDDLRLGLTDDRHLNAKHAAEISRIKNKDFTNKYKTY